MTQLSENVLKAEMHNLVESVLYLPKNSSFWIFAFVDQMCKQILYLGVAQRISLIKPQDNVIRVVRVGKFNIFVVFLVEMLRKWKIVAFKDWVIVEMDICSVINFYDVRGLIVQGLTGIYGNSILYEVKVWILSPTLLVFKKHLIQSWIHGYCYGWIFYCLHINVVVLCWRYYKQEIILF